MSTWESPGLALPAAVQAEGIDAGVAAHYGEPMREQRMLAAGAAVVDMSHYGVVRVAGRDRLTWLHDLTSQQLRDLPAHQPTEALLLSPHGHVEHHLYLVDDGQSCWVSVEPGTATALATFLDRMRFMLRVEVADVTGDWAVVAEGPGLRRRLVARDEIAQVLAAAPGVAGFWAAEALRIAAGRARFGQDSDHRSIPNEAGWIGTAVHLDKGCYRGQETVARVHTLGRPPRRLTLLHLDGHADELPGHGASVVLDGRDVGFVGSSARHFELGPIALAMLKRSVPLEATLLAGGVAAAQEAIVDPDVGLHVRPRLG